MEGAVVTVDAELLDRVRTHLVAARRAPDAEAINRAVRESGRVLDHAGLAALTRALQDELEGLGALQPVLADPTVTDLLINGPDQVWVDRGGGLTRLDVSLRDEATVRQLAVRLAARAGRRLDDAAPFVDARLPAGQRLHAVLPPLSVHGTSISLRIPGRRRFNLDSLVASGTVDADGARWLRALVASRTAFLVSGGTGSGKTTVLGALLGLVPHDQRVVIVEDTCELRPEHPHVVSLESRSANVEGSGEIPMRTLVRQALRMRPDRLVVGEVRGAEVVDMLAGFNTGHEGGAGTIHANTAGDVPERIEALALAAGMPLAGIRAQVAAGLEAVVHVARRPDGQRIVAEVGMVRSGSDGVQVVPGLRWGGERLEPGPAHAELAQRLGLPDVEGSGQVAVPTSRRGTRAR
jgi:pilus assembly protein CpaF